MLASSCGPTANLRKLADSFLSQTRPCADVATVLASADLETRMPCALTEDGHGVSQRGVPERLKRLAGGGNVSASRLRVQ